MEEKIRTAIPADTSTLMCIAEFERGFPDYVPTYDSNIYNKMAKECAATKTFSGIGTVIVHVVNPKMLGALTKYLEMLSQKTLVAVMLEMSTTKLL